MHSAVFFDLDKTISSVPTEKYFAFHLFRRNVISLTDMLCIIWETLKYDFHFTRDFQTVKKDVIRIVMKGQDAEQMREIFTDYYQNFLKKRIFPAMLLEIEAHKAENRHLVIISASLDFIVKEFCEDLDMDEFYAARLEIRSGVYTGRTIGKIYMGLTKHEAVLDYARRHHIDLKTSYAYGDYYEDYHMLSLVGNPVAINPDKKLLRLATDNAWTVKNCESSY